MANYTLTGDLGAGKTIIAVGKIRDHLISGRPVAGNLDVYLERLVPPSCRSVYLRLPDFPSASDLWQLGRASDSKRESTFGLLVLDELAVFLNSREWQGQARDQVIKYLRHVRKQHWHTLFITQDIESIDAQARRALVEHKVVCKRTDRMKIPFIGSFLRLFGLSGNFAQLHIGFVRYGKRDNAPVVAHWHYYGKGLYDAYNTDQVFTEAIERDGPVYFVPAYRFHYRPMMPPVVVPDQPREHQVQYIGPCTMLSAWHLKGRYLSWYDRNRHWVNYLVTASIALTLLIFGFLYAPKVHHEINSQRAIFEKASSYLQVGNQYAVTLPSGAVVMSRQLIERDGKFFFVIGNTWYEKP